MLEGHSPPRTSFTQCWSVGCGSQRSSGLPSTDFVSGSRCRLGPANDSLRSAWRVSREGGGDRRSPERPHRANFASDYGPRRCRRFDSEPARAVKHELWQGGEQKKQRGFQLLWLPPFACFQFAHFLFSRGVFFLFSFFLGRHVRVNNPLLATLGPLSTLHLVERDGGGLQLPAGFSFSLFN